MLSFFSKSFLGETEIDSQINSCIDRKSTRLNSSHSQISYAVFCLKKKKIKIKLARELRSAIEFFESPITDYKINKFDYELPSQIPVITTRPQSTTPDKPTERDEES